MADVLEIVILGKDQASKVFKGVGDSLGTAFKVGAGLAVSGLTALTASLGLAVSEAMEAEEIQAELNAVLKSTGFAAGMSASEINSLATELSNVTKFSDDQIVSAQTLLLTFTQIGEKIFPQATEAALNMAEIFGSADAAALQLGKALNDPIAGVGALRRVGVSFTKEQEDMIKAMVESGDVMGAQKLILAELEKEFGGVARAAGDTLGGKLVILKNKIMDVVEGVGMKLIPPLTNVVDFIIREGVPAFESIITVMEPFLASIVWPFERFVDALSGGTPFFEALQGLFSDMALTLEWLLVQFGVSAEQADKFTDVIRSVSEVFVDFIRDAIVPFVKEHAEGFKTALITIGAILAGAAIVGGILAIAGVIASLFNPITLIIGAIGLLAMAWKEDWGGIRSYITDVVWPAVKPILEDIKEWFEVAIPKAVIFLRDVWETYLVPTFILLKALWDEKIKPALSDLADWFMKYIPLAGDSLKGYWEGTLLPALNSLWEFWDQYLMPLLEDLVGYFDDLLPVAIDILTGTFASDLLPSLEDIKSAVSDVVTWLGKMAIGFGTTVANAISNVMPFINDVIGKFTEVKNLINGILGSSGNSSAPYITGALAASNQVNIPPPNLPVILPGTSTVKKNYNKNYTGPQSRVIMRDKGGSGLANKLYGIGVPELFIPDSRGTFAPLTEGNALASSIEELKNTVNRLAEVVRGIQSQAGQQNNYYNLNLQSGFKEERVKSDFNTLKAWSGRA